MGIADRNHQVARQWMAEGKRLAIAMLVDAEGSVPLDPGAMMLIGEDARIEGSVTGGCVETALVQEAAEALAGDGPRLRSYGISDEAAGNVGLMCGGNVTIFIEEPAPEARDVLDQVFAGVLAQRPAAIATLVNGPKAGARLGLVDGTPFGSLRSGELLDSTVEREMAGMLDQGVSCLRSFGADGATMGAELAVHVLVFGEPPSLLIFGAGDFATATAALADQLGFRVTVVDGREPFVRSERLSGHAEVVVEWPDRYLRGRRLGPRDAVLVLTHDSKFDQPALIAALDSGAGYVGALGSRRTQRERIRRLSEAGLGRSELERIAAPCGLDIGARTPAETAVSIMAEIIARQNGRAALPLTKTSGPIHPPRAGLEAERRRS